jgi:DNA-binding transcriptional ArsR family regulator
MRERLEQERVSLVKSIVAADGDDETAPAVLFGALADPIRLRILALIRRPMSVTEICHGLELAQPRVSHHLAVLREAGLVSVKPSGRQRVYAWAAMPSSRVRDLHLLLARWFSTSGRARAPREEITERSAGSSHPPTSSGDMDDYLL